MNKKVFIGVGHGGSDPGASANGLTEKNVNLNIALSLKAELESQGVKVAISRVKDENDPLADEIKECNAFNPDLAVEIHNNAGGGDGAEVYHYSKGGTSKTLAQNILNEIVAIGQNSRGLKTKLDKSGKDYFGFIRDTKAPAVIVEAAFLDNKNDVNIINTPEKQKNMGIAVAKGVLKTLGFEYKTQVTVPKSATSTTAQTPKKIYRVQVGAFSDKANAEKLKKELINKGYNAIIQ